MKEFLNKKGLVIVFSLILLMVFIFGGMYSRFMTNQIDVHSEERYVESLINLVDGGTYLESFESTGSDKMYRREYTGEMYTPELLESYKVYDENDEAIAHVYVIRSMGFSERVIVAYALSLENHELLDINLIEHQERTTDEDKYFNLLDEDFFDQFENRQLDVVDFSLDVKAGATYSSMAFDAGMKFAREVFANDTEFDIIRVQITIDELRFNHDLETLDEYPFIVDVTFGQENKTATVALNNELEFVETLAGEELNDNEKEALPSYVLEADLLNIHHITIVSYDETTKTIRLRSRGYSNQGVTIDIVLSDSLDAVEEVVFVSSSENYDNGYNAGYNGGSVPSVENLFIDSYNDEGIIIDGVAGASVTSCAVTCALQWVESLEAALNGGN